MISAIIVLAAVLFVWAVFGTAAIITTRATYSGKLVAKQAEIDAINKVGKWYQDRVAELENESRALAEQVIASGSIVRHAMPTPQPDGGMVYLTDDTGLVVDAVKASEYHGE